MRTRLTLVTAVLLVGSTGCDGCDTGRGSGAPDAGVYASAPEIEAFSNALLRLVCERNLDCGAGRREFDLETCMGVGQTALDGRLFLRSREASLSALAGGRSLLRRDQREACLAAIAQVPCWRWWITGGFELPACRAAVDGTQGAGARCLTPDECGPGLDCPWADCDSAVCTSPGECVYDEDCPIGRWCSRGAMAGATTCAAPLANGERCDGDAACASLFCDPFRRVCDGGSLGAPCTASCAHELLCLDGRCAEGGLGDPCWGTSCARGLGCLNGRCAEKGGRGAACSPGSCADGLACIVVAPESRCTADSAAGESCATRPCGRGVWCEPTQHVCVPQAPDGATCRADDECASWSCRNTCQPRVAPPGRGESCEWAACSEGLACDGTLRRCVDAPKDGEPCGRSCAAPGCAEPTLCARGLRCDERGLCHRSWMAFPSCAWEPCPDGFVCAYDTEQSRNDPAGSRCVPAPQKGAACAAPSWNSASASGCAPNLVCRPDTHGDPVCRSFPGEGASCDQGRCAAWLSCVYSPLLPPACGDPPTEGRPCSDVCAPGLQCEDNDLDGRHECHRRPREGEPCRILDGGAEPCADPSNVCVPQVVGGARCMRAKHEGEACTEPLECGGVLSPSLCDIASGRCVHGPRSGEPCFALREYRLCDALHAWCDRSTTTPTCRAFLPDGAACDSGVPCGVRARLGRCDLDQFVCVRESDPRRCLP